MALFPALWGPCLGASQNRGFVYTTLKVIHSPRPEDSAKDIGGSESGNRGIRVSLSGVQSHPALLKLQKPVLFQGDIKNGKSP